MRVTFQSTDRLVLVSRPIVALLFLVPMTLVFLISTVAMAIGGHWLGTILCALTLLMVGGMLAFGVEWTTVSLHRPDDQIRVFQRGWRSQKVTRRVLSRLSDIEIEPHWNRDSSSLRLTFADGAAPVLLPVTTNGEAPNQKQAKALRKTIDTWCKG